jgi:N-acetylglucosamine kinase-like BadF-type ATPase
MSPPRKVSPEMAVEVVRMWLRWHDGQFPGTTLADLFEKRFGISYTQAFRYVPEFIKRASTHERAEYLRLGWPAEHAAAPEAAASGNELAQRVQVLESAIQALQVRVASLEGSGSAGGGAPI